jgi:hypothetical protein
MSSCECYQNDEDDNGGASLFVFVRLVSTVSIDKYYNQNYFRNYFL